MKKTLTVNLSGIVFNIDEDAYQLLDKYLSNLREHFKTEEGTDEIMDDFEARIAELLDERIRLGHNVISIEHVEEVINRMGKPEDLFDGEKTEKEDDETETTNQTKFVYKKKLMRDPDDKIIGGVASGIAAYMGWDTTAVRCAFILLLFIPYCPAVFIYILLWLLTPLARTAADKLRMKGESVTIENIGKTVTDNFEKVSNKVSDIKTKNTLHKIADLLVTVIGYILKFLAIIALIFGIPILAIFLLVMVVIALGIVLGGGGLIYNLLTPLGIGIFDNIHVLGEPGMLGMIGFVSLILLIGIPLFTLIYIICCSIFKLQPLSKTAKITLLVIWCIALLAGIYFLSQAGYEGWKNLPFPQRWHRLHIYY